jgi:hypothetical protein
MCENGVLRRSLSYLDGETTRQGEPIPEEAAFEEDCFYMEEVELLMNSFGMTPYGDDSLAPRIVAWQVVDRTDYEKLRRERKSGPWWKFW